MPADYVIDRVLGVVLSRAWAVLTDADLFDHQARLGQDPQFDPSLNQLFDFDGVTDVQVTSVGIRTLASRDLFRSGSRRAFTVRPGALAMFGVLRMFEILTSESPHELSVQFNEVTRAREWLGIPDTKAEAS